MAAARVVSHLPYSFGPGAKMNQVQVTGPSRYVFGLVLDPARSVALRSPL